MNFSIKKRSERNKWMAQWFEQGKRRRKSFASHDAACQWVRDQKKLTEAGSSPFEITAAARAAAGTGYDLETLVRAGLERMRDFGANRANMSMTFAEASEKVIARATKDGARASTIAGYRALERVLTRTFGTRVVGAILHTEVEEHLACLCNRQREMGKASIASKKDHLGYVRMCMRIAGIADPLPDITLPRDESDVEFFSVAEVKGILAATPKPARGFVAVALFGCVRPENLALLPADAVSLEARRIRIPKNISKDRRGHLLEDHQLPSVLWDWLKPYPYSPVNWPPLQRRLRRAIGRWIQDGLRHTGATYFCATRGVNQTAQLLTHESERLVRENYAGLVPTVAVAHEFLALKPSKIKFVEYGGVKWPSDSSLARMLAKKPAVAVAKELGCSDSALIKRCRVRGIAKPGRGFWTKQALLQ